jgi:hypothetical protein
MERRFDGREAPVYGPVVPVLRRSPSLRAWPGLVLALLPACAGPDPADSGENATTDEPDEVYYTEGDVEPGWTAAEAREAMQGALARGLPLPSDIADTYVTLLAEGDARCPGLDGQISDIVGCTSDSGYFYAGVSGYGANHVDDTDVTIDQVTTWGDAEVRTPDGLRFGLGGSTTYRTVTHVDGSREYDGELSGTFDFPGSDTSLADGMSGVLDLYAMRAAGKATLQLDGGIGVGDRAFAFDDFSSSSAECGDHPTGGMRLRDDAGRWYTLTWGDACTGCGDVVFDGRVDLGEECFDPGDFVNALVAELLP